MGAETTPEADGKPGWVHRIVERLLEELRRFALLFIYLWLQFGLFVLDGEVVTRQQGLAFSFQGFAVLNALVLAKVMLVAEDLELARGLKGRPVIWTILFETVLCTALLLGFFAIEHIVIGVYHGKGAAASVPSYGGGGLSGVVLAAVIVFISLVPFFGFKNLARAIGIERTKEILFRTSKVE